MQQAEQKPVPVSLHTENPEQLIYAAGEIRITVLGGVRLEGLDRMRVTLKIEAVNRKYPRLKSLPDIVPGTAPSPPGEGWGEAKPAPSGVEVAVRHSIDLYNELHVNKLVRITSEKLEIGTHSVFDALNNLTNELENYRLTELEKIKSQRTKQKHMNPEETGDALRLLQTPNLVAATTHLIRQSGIIGEERNALLMYLIFTSRKTTRPLHCISFGSSGTGKSHLQEKIGELMPDEEVISITSLTENAFYYFGQQELKNKLILIEDLDGAEGVLYPLRELQSKRSITKTVTIKTTQGQTKTVTLKVEGPVSVAGCTTKESVYEDNANRSFLLYLDESKEQDARVMQYQKQLAAGSADLAAEQAARSALQNVQRVLQPVTVKNPYAQFLELPGEVFKPRRTNAHYLQLIEVVTFYHQYQREQCVDEATGEVYIETTPQDIEIANELIKDVLLRKSDELNKSCRQYLEQVKTYLQQEKKKTFCMREVRFALRLNYTNQKRYMLMLLQNGYLKKVKSKKGVANQYQIADINEFENLRERISQSLNRALQAAHSPTADQSPNGPHKPQKKKQLKQAVQKNEEKKASPLEIPPSSGEKEGAE